MLAGALLLAGAGLQADEALRLAFCRRVIAAAAGVSCSAEVWAPNLGRLPAGWTLAGLGALPSPGSWRPYPARLRSPSGAEATVGVRVRLLPAVKGWILTRTLAPGQPVTPGCVRAAMLDPRDLAGTPVQGPLRTALTAARGLPAGRALLAGDLRDPSYGRPGERVVLVIHYGSIAATDAGVLLEGGPQGSVLKAQHLRSGRVVRGTLDGRDLLVED